jgi:hypothetical protein
MNARYLPVPDMCGSVAIGYGRVRVTPGVKDDGTEQEKEGAGTMAIGNLMELAGDGGGGTGKAMCGFANVRMCGLFILNIIRTFVKLLPC